MSFAEEINVFFNWELYTVPNIGHNAQEMANDALEYLLATNLNVNNLNPSNLKFFPNPSSDYIFIDNNHDIDVSIFDLNGKKVFINKMDDGLDISSLDKGMYIIVLDDGTNLTIEKIIKN